MIYAQGLMSFAINWKQKWFNTLYKPILNKKSLNSLSFMTLCFEFRSIYKSKLYNLSLLYSVLRSISKSFAALDLL